MNILVTGAKGFTGRNLVENLKNIRDGKNKTRLNLNGDYGIPVPDYMEKSLDSNENQLVIDKEQL